MIVREEATQELQSRRFVELTGLVSAPTYLSHLTQQAEIAEYSIEKITVRFFTEYTTPSRARQPCST